MRPSSSLDRAGTFSIVLGSALWGLFWWPLRFLEERGLDGPLAIAVVYGGACVMALAWSAVRGEIASLGVREIWPTGLLLGLAGVLYFIGILLSDVVRVVFLFYLLPVWTILAARMIYGEPVRRGQFGVMAIVLTGLWLLLGADGLPLPNNLGDACAIASGVCWGFSLALLRGRDAGTPLALTIASLVGASAVALLVLWLLPMAGADAVTDVLAVAPAPNEGDPAGGHPGGTDLALLLIIGAAFGAALLLPSMFGQVWGARRVPAPMAALFTMTEILVATASAGLIVGTRLDALGLAGGLLIVTGVGIDVALHLRSSRVIRAAPPSPRPGEPGAPA